MSTCQSIRPVCTRIAAESRSSAVPSLRPTGSPSCLAGGEQVVLLHTVSCFWGAKQAAETVPTADTGAKAAAPVSRATRLALEENGIDFSNIIFCYIISYYKTKDTFTFFCLSYSRKSTFIALPQQENYSSMTMWNKSQPSSFLQSLIVNQYF